MSVINEVADKTKEQAINQLWSARRQLEDVEAEIFKIKGELQELEDIDCDYSKAYTIFHNSLDSRVAKLSKLESLSNDSNSAKTYSTHLSTEMCGNNAVNIIAEFDNVRNVIANKISTREEKIKELQSKRDNLEYTIYRANTTIYEVENRTNS